MPPLVTCPATFADSTNTFVLLGFDQAHGIAPTTSGYYVVGGSNMMFILYQAWVIKVDNTGGLVWDYVVDPGAYIDVYAVDVTPDDGCVAVGVTNCVDCDAGSGPWIGKFSSLGSLEWQKMLGGGALVANSVFTLSEGDHIVAGSAAGAAYIARLSQADGTVMWSNTDITATGGIDPVFKSVVRGRNGNMAAVGNIEASKCIFAEFDSGDGTLITRVDPIGWNSIDICNAICYTTENNYIIAGSSTLYGNLKGLAFKMDAGGNFYWGQTFGGSDPDTFKSVKQLANGNLIFAGATESTALGVSQFWLYTTDIDGNFVWEKTYGDIQGSVAESVCVSSSGSIGAAGYDNIVSGADRFFVVIRNPSGCSGNTYWDPATTGCEQCHKLCSLCHGPSNNDCDQCDANIPNTAAIVGSYCNCLEGYYFDTNQVFLSDYCQPCSKFCAKCSDGVCTECAKSDGLIFFNGECLCSVPGYFSYFNTAKGIDECVKCHPLCLSCTGPLLTQCDQCDSTKNAVATGVNTCGCLDKHFYDTVLETCAKCNPLCQNCIGPGNDQCVGCDLGLEVEGQLGLCVGECEEGYFLDNTVHKCKSIVCGRTK